MKQHRTLRRGLSILLSLLLCLTLVPATALAAGTVSVAINDVTFPDETFREKYVRGFDKNNDGTLSAEEINAVERIVCHNMYGKNENITSLKGIEYFTALTTLNCCFNQLTSLDVSKNTELWSTNFSPNTYKYKITTLGENRTFDLSTLPEGFDVNKARDWNGGTVSRNILTFDPDAMTVTYTYDCGNGRTATFTLDATPQYTITFNANGGSGSMADVTDVSGNYTLPACEFTAPEGKQFKGWAISAGGEVINEGSIDVTDNMTLYAVWEDKPISGGGYIPTVQKPVIEGDAGVAWTLSSDGTKLTISAKEGYTLADVTLNGTSKGQAAELTGLKTGDKVVIRTVSDADVLAEKLAAVKLVARSKMSAANGKAAIKVYWYAEDGSDINIDGYEVFRSTKRYSGFGKTPIFETDRETYWNTAIKSGTTYYYKVRGYIELNGERYYTGWSMKAIRTVK